MNQKGSLIIGAVLLFAAAIISFAVPGYWGDNYVPKVKQYRRNSVGNVNFGPPRTQSTYWQFADTNKVTVVMTAQTFTATTNMGATAAGIPLPPGKALPLGYYETNVVLSVVQSFAVKGLTLSITMSSSYFCDQIGGAGADTVAVYLSPPSGGPTKLLRIVNTLGGWPITGAPYAPYGAVFTISDSGVSADTLVRQVLFNGEGVTGRLADTQALNGTAGVTLLCEGGLSLTTLYKDKQSSGNWTVTIRNLCGGVLSSNFVNAITLTLLGPTVQTVVNSSTALKDTTSRSAMEAQHSVLENGRVVYKLTRSQSER